MTIDSTTRHSLGIFWQGEEVDGFTCYGYWPSPQVPQPTLDLRGWQSIESKGSKLVGDDWTVWLWDVRVRSWPVASQWRSLVVGTLTQLLQAGATVAWCGTEGAFADPPSLFDPQQMSGGIWAARINGQDAVFEPPGLDEPFHTLNDDQLIQLRRAAGLGFRPR